MDTFDKPWADEDKAKSLEDKATELMNYLVTNVVNDQVDAELKKAADDLYADSHSEEEIHEIIAALKTMLSKSDTNSGQPNSDDTGSTT